MTSKKDHYATLGLDRRCPTSQIRNAYRLLAKQHHPDVNHSSPAASALTQALNAAYEVLSDPARRRGYDRELHDAEKPAGRAGRIEHNIAQNVHLRIDGFFRGATLQVLVKDPARDGELESYDLVIPPGTAPGVRFRIPRKNGGLVQVRVRAQPNMRFKARGSDLRCDLRINAKCATEGGTESLTGPTGTSLRLQIPRGVKRGEIVRIPGEGLPKPRSGRGDLLVRITYRPEVRISRIRS